MTTFLATFLLFFLPLVVVPFGLNMFEPPKVILAQVVIQILLFSQFFQKDFIAYFKHQKAKLILPLSLIFLSLLHLVLNPTLENFLGNQFRMQGVFLLWNLIILFLIAPRLSIENAPRALFPFCLTLLLATTIFLGGNENGRAVGTLGEPNALAATAVFFLPFLLFKQKKLIKILGFIFVLIIVFLSGSRSGLIALTIQSSFLILNNWLKLSILKSFIIGIILLILSFSFPIIEGGGWFENRSQIWQTAFFAGLNSPIIGNGFGNIGSSIHQASVAINNLVQHQLVDSSHNIFLDFWVQGGITGVIVFIAIIFFSVKNLIKQSKILELACFLGLLSAMSFNPVSVVTLVAFWWILGRSFSHTKD